MSHSSLQETELMNIETAHHHEEDKMRVLYEASYKGCVSTLNSLLQEDPGLLFKISSQTIFIETPLHISCSHGHLQFTKTLLSQKPELALEQNSLRSTPLHLASAEGHIDIVKQLVEARKEACLAQDQECRIPLHYAVIRGRRDVVLELIRAKPESLKILDKHGKTIFHLCVTYNQLEVLKELVAFDPHGTLELLIERDLDGNNTILHLAIMLKQVETVRYLISIPKIRSEASNLKNDMGYTATDIVERIPKDSKSLEIKVILMESGIKCGRRERIDLASEGGRNGKKWWSWRKVFKIIDEWLMYNGDRLEDMKGNLCTVASVISTITFQASLNPPGSFVQQGIRSDSNSSTLPQGPLTCLLSFKDQFEKNHNPGPCPGQAIFSYVYPDNFGNFIRYNTMSFVSSLSVALLIVSGIPLKRRFMMWMISIGMCTTLTSLLNAYLIGLSLITPYRQHNGKRVLLVSRIYNVYSVVYALLVSIYTAVIYVIWVVKKLKGKLTEHRRPTNRDEHG